MRARFTIENLKIRTAHKTYFLLEKERSRLCISARSKCAMCHNLSLQWIVLYF